MLNQLNLPLPSPKAKVKERGRTGKRRSMLDVFNEHQARNAEVAAIFLKNP